MTATKKNTGEQYIPNTQGIYIDTKGIITGVVTTLVVGAILGVVSYSRVTDSNTYRTATNASDIQELEEKKLDKSVYDADLKSIDVRLNNIEKGQQALLANFKLTIRE